jgi:hypothetical protein
MSTWLRDPKGSTAFAMANSKELPSRFETIDRDVKENVRRLAGKHDLGSLVQRFGYSGIAVFDHMVAVPTWLGAYNKALAAGLEEQQAIHDADAAVRDRRVPARPRISRRSSVARGRPVNSAKSSPCSTVFRAHIFSAWLNCIGTLAMPGGRSGRK